MILPYIPIMILLLWGIIFGLFIIYNVSGLKDAKYKMNKLYKCRKCELVHRAYQRKLIRKENICPHCYEYNSYFEDIYSDENEGRYSYPLSPKIKSLNALKIVKLDSKQNENEYIEKQLEIYLKLQEKQLDQVKKLKLHN